MVTVKTEYVKLALLNNTQQSMTINMIPEVLKPIGKSKQQIVTEPIKKVIRILEV